MATRRQRALAEIRRLDHIGIGGIAGKRLDAKLFERGDPILVVLDDEERDVPLAQGRADEAADPAMADQHHVVLEACRADRLAHRRLFLLRVSRCRLGERLLPPRRVDVERGEEKRIEEDGDDGAGENEVAALLGQ